jgi:hypothetical protein
MGFNMFQSCRARAGWNPEPGTDHFRLQYMLGRGIKGVKHEIWEEVPFR